MKRMNIKHLLGGILIVFFLACILPSCSTAKKARLEAQRKGLMLGDKGSYTMNSKFKGSKSKSFKKLKKSSMKMKRKKRRW